MKLWYYKDIYKRDEREGDMLFGALGRNFVNDWTDKDDNKQANSDIMQPNIFDKLIVDAFSLSTQQFHQKFLYGQKVLMLEGSKITPMSVYLDNERDKLLWISSKSQAFLLDLYFTKVSIKDDMLFKKSLMKKLSMDKTEQRKYFYLKLKHLQQNIIFAFETENQRNQYFNLFSLYINQLKRQDPTYNIYFSNISKLHAMNTTKSGTNQSSFHAVMDISHKVGLIHKKQSQQILHNCLKIWNVKDQKKIPLSCINQYFRVQFCNRKLQPIYEKFSKPLGNIIKNCRLIQQKNMTPENFTQFLRTIQKQSEQSVKNILKSYSSNLSFFDFCRYLYDSEINNASHMEQNDVNHPLKDYFCYSSHNTYLSGNQLNSDCQVERYSQDLQTGIKCVELDIHNNGLVPIVTHALNDKSFCKPILFEDIIKVVQLFSEKYMKQNKSHYPIILSLQNHASNENRQIMLDILTRYLKKKLYFLQGHQKTFPQLSFLMGNIIIKTSSKQSQLRGFKKKILIKRMVSNSEFKSFDNYALSQAKFKDTVLQQKYQQFLKNKDELQRRMFKFNGRMQALEQVYIPVSSMGKVTTIFKSEQGIAGGGVSQFECVSYTNEKVIKSNPQELINYTKTSWLRTYPIGTQIYSNNYDPCAMLAVGAQIIALNTQTKDYYAWLMNGYFCGGHASKNYLRGYVLKPRKLRQPQLFKNLRKMLRIMTIQLIETSAQNIVMKFFGLQQDNQLNARSVNQFRFYNPDESFIVFNIGDQLRDCVAVRWIREGYRIIQGKNINNYMDCGRRVLIKITIRTE